ncbi:nucleotidyltransferase [Acidobacteria bacterium ACD]|nr:MAG: nucleotidyltransferase [Acidobacteriota bacterium]MCE7956605.1 nucleotidyltransferase [Acidobacteria bacterium ACB2]MDL1948380.1 nucleotidyltransferase [Acidobacteria bacterium ACD]
MTAPLESLLSDLESALARLDEALREPKSDIVRDAAIQRFEFSFELLWKTLKVRSEAEGLRLFSPREAFRAAFQIGLLDEGDDVVFQMLEDRNRTSHLYKAAMAEEVYSRLPAYLALMRKAARRAGDLGRG